MSKHPIDLCALGARALSTRALVHQLVGADDVDAAVAALALHHRARDAALLDLKGGPRLLAALELGRRAWLHPPPIGARVTGPVDAVAAVAARLVDDARAIVIALDVRGRVARVVHIDDDVHALQTILGAGCTRGLVVEKVERAAVPAGADVDRALGVKARGVAVGVDVVDHVLVGDDGFCSLLRLGLLGPRTDRRYQ